MIKYILEIWIVGTNIFVRSLSGCVCHFFCNFPTRAVVNCTVLIRIDFIMDDVSAQLPCFSPEHGIVTPNLKTESSGSLLVYIMGNAGHKTN